MKYFIGIVIVIFSYFVYLSKTSISFNHLFHFFIYEPNDLRKHVFYKDLEKIEDIEGVYKFNCKYAPEYYNIGIGFKYEYLATKLLKSNPEPVSGYKMKTNIRIKNDKTIIYENLKDNFLGGYGGDFEFGYYSKLGLARFDLNKCEEYILEIDYLGSDLENLPKDLLYLYVTVDISK